MNIFLRILLLYIDRNRIPKLLNLNKELKVKLHIEKMFVFERGTILLTEVRIYKHNRFVHIKKNI